MLKFSAALILVTLSIGCGSSPRSAANDKPTTKPPPKITMFYATPSVVRDNEPSRLCYSVEGASELTLDPPIERVWPALSRCFDVAKPKKNTTYTLTATNAEGLAAKASTEITLGPPSVKIVEVSVNSLDIAKGEPFPFCVTAKNAANWKLSAGQWRTPPTAAGGCAVDHPAKTTTYTITAIGALGETDTEHVTATVK